MGRERVSGESKEEEARANEGDRKGRSDSITDVRDWDEAAYRRRLLSERRLSYRTVFRAAFAPSSTSTSSNQRFDLNLDLNPNHLLLDTPLPDTLVAASTDGSIAAYSLTSSPSSLQVS